MEWETPPQPSTRPPKGGVCRDEPVDGPEFAPAVRLNVVAPGWIRTQWLDGAGAEVQQRVADATPLGRAGTPDDIAGAVAFWPPPRPRSSPGQTLLVNGGVVMS